MTTSLFCMAKSLITAITAILDPEQSFFPSADPLPCEQKYISIMQICGKNEEGWVEIRDTNLNKK